MGSLFKPKMPEPKPVVPMADPDGPEALAAKRRRLLAQSALSGRASTELSRDYINAEKLGVK